MIVVAVVVVVVVVVVIVVVVEVVLRPLRLRLWLMSAELAVRTAWKSHNHVIC